MTTFNPVTIKNSLEVDVVIYDVYNASKESQYKDSLTKLASIKAGASAKVTPIHAASFFLGARADSNQPVFIYKWMSIDNNPASLEINATDQKALSDSLDFVTYAASHKKEASIVKFKSLWDTTSVSDLVKSVDSYFNNSLDYKNCCYETYLAALRYHASLIDTLDKTTSLASLVKYLGGSWPPALDDIEVNNVITSTKNGMLDVWGELDMDKLKDRNQQFSNLNTITKKKILLFHIDVSVMGVTLACYFDTLSIPTGNGHSLNITKPHVVLSINPMFKFAVIKVIGDIPFTVFGTKLNTLVSLVIDNIEANVGITLEGDKKSLPAPPGIKGLHLDSFGVEMGVFFKPVGLDLGLQGKFHIGEAGSKNIKIKDDEFGMVLNIEDDVPNPVYLSFYLSELSLDELVTLFTNSKTKIPFPVTYNDLSFYWSEEPIALPDGTLSPIGFGFSSGVDILGFKYYGQFRIDLTTGISADMTCAPISLGNIFNLKGDGKGVTIKVDSKGNPIQNNQIKQITTGVKEKSLVPAGGPVLTMSMESSPYFHMDAQLTFLDFVKEKIEATIGKSGVTFELDFNAILEDKMQCTLKDYDNFSGKFTFGINKSIALPKLGPVSLGHLHLITQMDTTLAITFKHDKLEMSVGGDFNFEGMKFTLSTFTLDANLKSLDDILKAIEAKIEDEAASIFKSILGDAGKWAKWLGKNIIGSVSNAAKVLKNGYKEVASKVAPILKSIGFSANDAAKAMKGAGYAADQIASGLNSAFSGLGINGITSALKFAGCGASEVAQGLKYVGFGAKDVSKVLKSSFKLGKSGIESALKVANYSSHEISKGLHAISSGVGSVLGHLNPF